MRAISIQVQGAVVLEIESCSELVANGFWKPEKGRGGVDGVKLGLVLADKGERTGKVWLGRAAG